MDGYETIGKFDTTMEADLVRSLLKANGLSVWIPHEHVMATQIHRFSFKRVQVAVQVPEDQAEEALRILAETEENAEDLDWEDAFDEDEASEERPDATGSGTGAQVCGNCGSEEVACTGPSLFERLTACVLGPTGTSTLRLWTCRACDWQWKA